VDASLIEADANKGRSIPGSEWNKDIDPERASRAVNEYLATLDDAAYGAATQVVPKFVSPSGNRRPGPCFTEISYHGRQGDDPPGRPSHEGSDHAGRRENAAATQPLRAVSQLCTGGHPFLHECSDRRIRAPTRIGIATRQGRPAAALRQFPRTAEAVVGHPARAGGLPQAV
jgi:hypothetical protein